MNVRVGTITELQGSGYEILVDKKTRNIVLAKFFDGNFIRDTPTPELPMGASASASPIPNSDQEELTITLALEC